MYRMWGSPAIGGYYGARAMPWQQAIQPARQYRSSALVFGAHASVAAEEEAALNTWNAMTPEWAELVEKDDPYRTHFLDPKWQAFVGRVQGLRVMDLACGEGDSSRKLAKAGASVVGVDFSRPLLTLARRKERDDALGITYRQGSFLTLPQLKEGDFDRVVCKMGLDYAKDLKPIFKHVAAKLKPGGEFIFVVRHPIAAQENRQIFTSPEGKPIGIGGTNRYFSRQPFYYTVTIGNTSKSVPIYRHTIASYMNALTEAGLTITKVAEPSPSAQLAKQYPGLEVWRWHPHVLMVRAKKT